MTGLALITRHDMRVRLAGTVSTIVAIGTIPEDLTVIHCLGRRPGIAGMAGATIGRRRDMCLVLAACQ